MPVKAENLTQNEQQWRAQYRALEKDINTRHQACELVQKYRKTASG